MRVPLTIRLARRAAISLVLMTAGGLHPFLAAARVVEAKLGTVPAPVGTICDAGGKHVLITVRDAREFPRLLGGRIGPGHEEKPLILVTEGDRDLEKAFRAAADEVPRVLGLIPARPGTGYGLDLTISEFSIVMDSPGTFELCLAYATIEATLSTPDSQVLSRKTLRIAFFDRTFAMFSIHEVVQQAVSRLVSETAWRAASELLVDQLHPAPRAEWVRRESARLPAMKDDVRARQIILWLALAGLREPPVKDDILSLMRTSKKTRVRHAAAEAVGILGLSEGRDDLKGIVDGTKPLGGWDSGDLTDLWYALDALALLGEKAPQPLPERGLSGEARRILEDLVRFRESGQAPVMNPVAAGALGDLRSGKKGEG